jgi:predicted dehydrogenase
MNESFPRVAIIGCGAVTELRHLPALAALKIKPVMLVDVNLDRARALAESHNIATASADHHSQTTAFDAAILALPHHLHAGFCLDLLDRGIHLLVEKPLALTTRECDAIIDKARKKNAILAVGLMRRFLHVSQWVKSILDSKLLGSIHAFDIREGSIYSWPMASSAFLSKSSAGGGVLIDTGAHTLDLINWWFRDVTLDRYYDDSYGGIEADCQLHLKLSNGADGFVELSRTRRLRGTAIINGDRGKIEVSLSRNQIISAEPTDILRHKLGQIRGSQMPVQDFNDLFVLQIQDWVRAIAAMQEPFVPGAEARQSVALIETCYKQRETLDLPWIRPTMSNSPALRK